MENILNNIGLVNLHISLWQGDKALKKEDLAANGIDVSKLPPGKLASLGCKRTIGKDATKAFVSYKREAHTICSKYGVKFGESGYAIPTNNIQWVCEKLSEIKISFINEKIKFLSMYEQKTNEWIEQNDYEWREVIRKSVDPVGKVESVLSFNFSAFAVNPINNIDNGLDEEVGGLYAQLCKEIRNMASISLKSSFNGKNSVSTRALRPLHAIITKLNSMSFIEETIVDLVKESADCYISADDAVKNNNGTLDGKALNEVIGMLTRLSNLGLKTVYEENNDLYEEELEEAVINNTESVAPVITTPNWDF